jgi:hypothetical protein
MRVIFNKLTGKRSTCVRYEAGTVFHSQAIAQSASKFAQTVHVIFIKCGATRRFAAPRICILHFVLAGRRAGCAESTLVPASTNHGVPSVTLQTPDVVRGPIASAQFEVGAGRREGGAPVQRDPPLHRLTHVWSAPGESRLSCAP